MPPDHLHRYDIHESDTEIKYVCWRCGWQKVEDKNETNN